MASPAPQNSVSPLQSYTKFWYTDNSMANIDELQLIAATNTGGYQPGCVVVQITSGPNAGKFVNYDPSGSVPGQNTITAGKVAILCDEYLTDAVSTSGGLAIACWGTAEIYADAIYWTEPGADTISSIIGVASNKIPGVIYGRNGTVVRLF